MSSLTHPDWGRWAVVVGCVVAAVSFAACGTDDAPESSASGSGSELFPGNTLEDWVSCGDHVAVYRVMSERALPLRAEERETGEGLAGREVVLRIERRLWSADGAPPLPDEIRMNVLGWVIHDGERRPIEPHDAPRVAPGERYLAPLALVELGAQPEWWPLTAGAQIPVEGDAVASARWNREITAKLSGLSIDEARSAIRAARPDPVAAELSDLRPQDRVQAVARRRSQGQSAPLMSADQAPADAGSQPPRRIASPSEVRE